MGCCDSFPKERGTFYWYYNKVKATGNNSNSAMKYRRHKMTERGCRLFWLPLYSTWIVAHAQGATMVFYFTSNVVSPTYTIYMGKDKYENEDLIKYGWPEDVWFHVDKLSSAHVYLRLQKGQTIDDIPKDVLTDCAQLVKANSIQGCKMNNINVVYTPWANLKKTADMDVGQIGFHRQKEVKTVTVEKKVNEILNRLEKTRDERFPDLAAEKESRDREERNEKKAQIQEMKKREKEEMKKKKEMEELRNYSSLMKAENMSSNQDGNDSDEFM